MAVSSRNSLSIGSIIWSFLYLLRELNNFVGLGVQAYPQVLWNYIW